MTRSEYYNEIESIAAETLRESREEGRDVDEVLHETIDGHQWVIYNANHLDVLKHSDHEEAGIEEGVIDANEALKDGGLYKLTAQLTYCAMEADVREAIARQEAA